ncbi:MAG: hypothetical protein IKR84_01285 [Oscillibacter sp.]|nr:hypothetical protein [Oscillibacter sp.]
MSSEEKPGTAQNEEKSEGTPKGNMSVFLYILLLFSAALLLMCLSSLIHQRNNTEALGKLQSSVSVMQEVQNLQEKIIALQEERRALEEELEEARAGEREASAQTAEARRQADAMRRLYLMQEQYREGRYRACQATMQAFEAEGLSDSLPDESPGNGVIPPLDYYRQLQEAVPARIAETAQAAENNNG